MFDRGISGGTELLIAGLLIGLFFGACVVPGIDIGADDNSPRSDAEHECEIAYEDQRDGDPDTEPAPVVNEPWCQTHNAAEDMIDAAETQADVQDAGSADGW
jgi:hypothetical protein